MWNRNAIVSGLALATVAFVGACSEVPPTGPGAFEPEARELFRGAPRTGATLTRSLDAQFVRIAREVPGFGGFYYGEDGALNVVMAPTVQTMSASQLTRALSSHVADMGVDLNAQPMRVVAGTYSFETLHAVHQQATSVLGLEGVVYTDTDERNNRVRIGIERGNAAAAASVERALGMLGLPREAVVVSETAPVEPLQTLNDRVRPIGGGLLIWRFVPPGQASLCTLGFNVRAPNHPNVQGFVTNSHCTEVRGEVTGVAFNQKALALPEEPVGVEEHDLPFFQGGECPVGRNCRYSDAAGVRYTVPPAEQAFGIIYRTTAPSQHTPGPLTIDPANPHWRITSETPFPTVGQTAHKTGRTTGWLAGPVIETCINTNVSGAGSITMLCQDRVEATSGGGDSGSPVFFREGETSDVSLAGILWGGSGNTFVFSAMENVRFENPGPAAWITYPGQTPPQ